MEYAMIEIETVSDSIVDSGEGVAAVLSVYHH
jgi:hypothetical protein